MKSIRLQPTGPWRGTVTLPGSKSETNRVLALALHGAHAFEIAGPSLSDDTLAMLSLAEAIGRPVQRLELAGTEVWRVPNPDPIPWLRARRASLKMAGTVLRFGCTLAAWAPGPVALSMKPRLAQRPLDALLSTLKASGGKLRWHPSKPSLLVKGAAEWQPSEWTLSHAESSQMLSALLLSAPHLPIGFRLNLEGMPPSPGYVAMTLDMLERLGYHWMPRSFGYALAQKPLFPPMQYTVEADWSGACYWLAGLMLTGGRMVLHGLRANSLQPDAALLPLLGAWGLQYAWEAGCLHLHVPDKLSIPAFEVDCALFPDQAQTLAVLAAFAQGICVLRGLHTLPLKETDRLAALAAELPKLGCKVKTDGKTYLKIAPRRVKPERQPTILTYGDHRMAMAFALASLRLPRLKIMDPGVVDKSYPEFWNCWAQLGQKPEWVQE